MNGFWDTAYDAVDQSQKCYECVDKDSKRDSGRKVHGGTSWVCDGCWPIFDKREQEKHDRIEIAKKSFREMDSLSDVSNEDIQALLDAGIICKTGRSGGALLEVKMIKGESLEPKERESTS